MKIAIVSGSHREKSESERVGRYLKGIVESKKAEAILISLAHNPLPLWDEGVWSGAESWNVTWAPIAAQLQGCDGLIIISPEWAGMVPPGLKNFLLLCSPAEVGHKPALIVTVSSGIGGSYPVTELRTSSYKNNRLVYLPEHVIVRNVGEMLHGEKPASEHDATLRARLGYGTELLTHYAQALKSVREAAVIDHKSFPFGM
jgi:NAD(P)H-dependent FMN reductase